jgi:hypothetical protein
MPPYSLCLVLLLAVPAGQLARPLPPADASPSTTGQNPAPEQESPTAPAPKIDPEDLPVSLDRIQRALARTPVLQFDPDARPVIRVQVFGERPTLEDILGPDYARGPVPHGSLTHQEFLEMVTPKDVQGYAAFSNGQGATVAATSFLFQWTLQRAIETYNETRDEQRRAAARQEVLDALQALEEARARAGL